MLSLNAPGHGSGGVSFSRGTSALLCIFVLLAIPLSGGPIIHSYAVDIFSLPKESWLAICSVYWKRVSEPDWLKVGKLPSGVERIFFADSTHGWCLVTTAGKEGEGTTESLG